MTVRPALALLLTILVTLSSASAARAQTLEAGGSIATSCKGSDGSFCNDTHSNLRTLGPYASVWFNDFIEVTGRVVWLDQPDINGSVMFPAPATFSIVERHRTLAQGEIVWHFLREKRVRLMFGLGAGRYWDREDVSCAPAGCEAGIAGLTVGRNRESHVDRIDSRRPVRPADVTAPASRRLEIPQPVQRRERAVRGLPRRRLQALLRAGTLNRDSHA